MPLVVGQEIKTVKWPRVRQVVSVVATGSVLVPAKICEFRFVKKNALTETEHISGLCLAGESIVCIH